MRAILTSLAVLALLCPAQIGLAQDAPPDQASVQAAEEAAKGPTATAKPEVAKATPTSEDGAARKAKPGKGRVGTLSADEAKRAARARKRAAAEFKGRGTAGNPKGRKPEVARSKEELARDSSEPSAVPETKAAKQATPAVEKPVKAGAAAPKSPVTAIEAPATKQPVKPVDAAKKGEPTVKEEAARGDSAIDKKSAADSVTPANVPKIEERTKTLDGSAKTDASRAGKSAEAAAGSDSQPAKADETAPRPDAKPADARPSKPTSRATAGKRSRARTHYAGEEREPRVGDVVAPGVRLDPVPQRYWRHDRGGRRVVGTGAARRRFYRERFADGPYMEAYPPFPGPYATYGAYPPPPVYIDP